jgi:hypothetical protein
MKTLKYMREYSAKARARSPEKNRELLTSILAQSILESNTDLNTISK